MKTNRVFASLIGAAVMGSTILACVPASAQSSLDRASHHRQKKKNEWRNIGIGSAALGVAGFATHNNALGFAGLAGAGYSAHRYEQDRKSQSQLDRLRASYFSRPYFVRDGARFDRRLVTKNGTQYYQFVRH